MTIAPWKTFEQALCWGWYESSILEDGRLRLNTPVKDAQKEHSTPLLWQHLDSTDRCVILSLPENQPTCVQTVPALLPQSGTCGYNHRKYLGWGTPAKIDPQERIGMCRRTAMWPESCLLAKHEWN